MGPAPISIPDFFTVEWYQQQKELKKTDIEIAESLFISIMTFHKWKQKIGWQFGGGRQFCGRKRNPHTEKMKQLKADGLTNKQIAEMLSITKVTVGTHLKNY